MLRNRILLGVAPLIILLMVVGGYAVWLFVRLPGEPREGAGLGLAICREIVRSHDGEIGVVTDQGGRGNEFFFTLPVAAMVAATNSTQT